MQVIGAVEARNTLGALLDRVELGEEIVITRLGRPVARLIPNAGAIDREKARAAAKRLLSRGRKVQGGFDWDNLKQDSRSGPSVSVTLDSSVILAWVSRGLKRFSRPLNLGQ